jgi:hypothetical protein
VLEKRLVARELRAVSFLEPVGVRPHREHPAKVD